MPDHHPPRHFRARGTVTLLILASAACAPHYAVAQQASSEQARRIRAIVNRRLQSDHLPGVAVCVVDRGKVTFSEAFGYADVSAKRPLTIDTPFQLASLSKQFAAVSVMLLVGEGKLSPEDPIGKYLKTIPDDWKQITVRQLLAHTSGIPDYASLPNIRAEYQQDFSRDRILSRISEQPLDFEPGAKFSYSNSGYTIVGCVIEAAAGQDYATFLQERLFGPLGMKTARLEPLRNQDPTRAIGYDYVGGKFRRASYNSPAWAFAAGGIVGSISDLAKWDAAIDRQTLLTARQQRELWTPQTAGGGRTTYGLGWMLRPAPAGKHFVLHLGGKPGFSTAMARLVEDRLTIAVLSNRTEGRASNILDEIGKLLLTNRAG